MVEVEEELEALKEKYTELNKKHLSTQFAFELIKKD